MFLSLQALGISFAPIKDQGGGKGAEISPMITTKQYNAYADQYADGNPFAVLTFDRGKVVRVRRFSLEDCDNGKLQKQLVDEGDESLADRFSQCITGEGMLKGLCVFSEAHAVVQVVRFPNGDTTTPDHEPVTGVTSAHALEFAWSHGLSLPSEDTHDAHLGFRVVRESFPREFYRVPLDFVPHEDVPETSRMHEVFRNVHAGEVREVRLPGSPTSSTLMDVIPLPYEDVLESQLNVLNTQARLVLDAETRRLALDSTDNPNLQPTDIDEVAAIVDFLWFNNCIRDEKINYISEERRRSREVREIIRDRFPECVKNYAALIPEARQAYRFQILATMCELLSAELSESGPPVPARAGRRAFISNNLVPNVARIASHFGFTLEESPDDIFTLKI